MTVSAPSGRSFPRHWLWLAVLGITLGGIIRSDLASMRWAAQLTHEGSPPPARDDASATGFTLGQRHFLGTQLRGETYRWIELTQAGLAGESPRREPYRGDTLPTGRPQLLPSLHAAWITVVAHAIQVAGGPALPLAVAQAALLEPVISHALVFLLLAGLLWRRLGGAGAAVSGLFFALFPPLSGQFMPGALTPDPWALFLGTWVLLLALPGRDPARPMAPVGTAAALAAGLALWLNPAIGFPVVLLGALAGVAQMYSHPLHPVGPHTDGRQLPFLRWSLIGAALVLAGWLLDRAPWDPAAGELRYIHPLYAFAWLGLGLGLRAWQIRVNPAESNARATFAALLALALLAPLAVVQVRHSFPGWLYTGTELARLTSLDETVRFPHLFAWLGAAGGAEILFVTSPILLAVIVGSVAFMRERPRSLLPIAVVFAGIVLLALFKVRWIVLAAFLAAPLLWRLGAALPARGRYGALTLGGLLLFTLAAWHQALPASLRRPQGELVPRTSDLEAMVFRHFSHWLASHTPGAEMRVLAPPALADSLVFHGHGRVLMSTAWESHPGLVAASRVLSSPESTEAEAVIESLGLTHIVVTSWDRVLPLLVKESRDDERGTLHERLQRWVLPRTLRALPYRLPPTPGYEAQKLAVFAVVPPQDEALSLSRLAEYFVEVGRPEPAGLVARALVDAFPQDPNAAMARAVVYEQARYDRGFQEELDRLASQVAADIVPFDWDRRAVRAIVLALGKRHDVARREIIACLDTMSEDALRQLTPLQAFRLRKLLELYQLEFPTPALAALAHALSAEYRS